MSDKPKKSCYHSELTRRGEVQVEVMADPIASTFKKGTFFVPLKFDGNERSYQPENDNCLAVFRGRKGQTLSILAEGSRETATIKILGGVAGPAQVPQNIQPTQTVSAAPQAAPVYASPVPPVNQPQNYRSLLMQLTNLHLCCRLAAEAESDHLEKERAIQSTEEQTNASVSQLFDRMYRDGCHTQMPSDRLLDIKK